MSSEVAQDDHPPAYGDPETRQRILQATWELLEERGAAVTLASAALRAGVSRQAVYLHFRDRSGLLVALVDYIDLTLGAAKLRAHVHGAPTGVESLERWIETMSWYTAKIDKVAQVAESSQYEDAALAAAWRDRMNRRLDHLRSITGRIAAEGRLAEGWTPGTAAELIHVVTMPGPWRELTREVEWTAETYAKHVGDMLRRSLLN
jgi:AcrR family transcriptional regulator